MALTATDPNGERGAESAGGAEFGAPEAGDAERETGDMDARVDPGAGPPGWGSRFPLDTRWGRIRAWANMFFVDHGFFRYLYLNLHRIDADGYRSAQPGPSHFARVARKGVRTIVNLRGGREFGSYPLEREACERCGLAYREIRMRSREAPRLEALREAEALFDSIEYPALFHCKSGADRAGLMSALYLIMKAGRPVAEAKEMLALRFGHVRQSKTGVLDAFLDAYDAAQQAAAAEGRSLGFMEWVETDYDPRALNQAFRTKRWADWLIDDVLGRE